MDRRRWIAAAVVAAVVPLAACDPADGGTPSPSATAGSPSSVASASPSPSPTSTEVPIREQMQRDKEAVKQAYVDAFQELNRLDVAGGATKVTEGIRKNTSGEYRRAVAMILKRHKQDGIRLTAPGELRGIALDGWTKDRIELTVCEDYSDVDWVDQGGAVVIDGANEKYIQSAVAILGKDERWRIDGIDTSVVDNFDTAECDLGGV